MGNRIIIVLVGAALAALLACSSAGATATVPRQYIVDGDSSYASSNAVSGDMVAWYDADGPCIRVKNLVTGSETVVADLSRSVYEDNVVMYGDKVAWAEMTTTPNVYAVTICELGGSPAVVGSSAWAVGALAIDDRYLCWIDYDSGSASYVIRCRELSSGVTTTPVSVTTDFAGLDISDGRLVWSQNDDGGDYNIYGCDLPSTTPYAICTRQAVQRLPAVAGDIVVWEDYRLDQNGDILGRDLGSATDLTVAGTGAQERVPAASDDWITYVQIDYSGYHLYVYDLAARTSGLPVDGTPAMSGGPDIDGSIVAWTDTANSSTTSFDIRAARLVNWDTWLQLDDGAEWTGDPSVTVDVAGSSSMGDVDQMRLLQYGQAWQGWQPFVSTLSFALTGPDGEKEVQAQFTDGLGDVSDIPSDTISLDTTKPSTSSDVDGAWHSSPVTVRLYPGDGAGSGVVKTEHELDGGDWFTGTSFVIPAPANHSNDGAHDLGFRSTDLVGNVEATKHATVRIETVPPTTHDDGDGAWHKTPVTLHFSAGDTGGSGLASTEYRLDAGVWQTGGSALILAPSTHANDGVRTVLYRSRDAAGNVEGANTALVHIDTSPPETSDNADGLWKHAPTTVHLTATDAGSGVALTESKVDDAVGWTAGEDVLIPAPSDHGNDGTHTILYRSTDALGTPEDIHTCTVSIDTASPVTTDDGDDGWHNEDVTVNLSATDSGGSGLDDTEYSLDGGDWTAGAEVLVAAPADHTADGSHVIEYRSSDLAGNVEPTGAHTVWIDTVAPVTSDNGTSTWRDRPVTLSFSAADSGSGVAQTEYRVDGGTWTSGSEVTLMTDGVFTVDYRSTDAAGNVEDVRTRVIRIDMTAPTTLSDVNGAWFKAPVTVHLSAHDAGCGVAYTQRFLDSVPLSNGSTVDVPAPSDHSYDGPHTIGYRSTDVLGNRESMRSCVVNIDTLAPELTHTCDNAWHAGAVLVLLTASDSGSGLSSTEYRIDASSWHAGAHASVPAPANHSNDGVHSFESRATDIAGNTTDVLTGNVRIDTTAPVTTDDADSAWHDSSVTVHFSAGDAGAGVAATEHRMDGGQWVTGSSAVVTAPADHSMDGSHALEYRSTDAVGNEEATRSCTVRIDTKGPVATCDAPDGWTNSGVTLHFGGQDDGCGVASTGYKLEGGDWTSGASATVPAPSDHSGDGVHTITFRATDLLGHTGDEQQCQVRIDTKGPETSAPSKATVAKGRTVRLKFKVADELSDKATASIWIAKRGGRVVKKLKVGKVATGSVQSYTYRCKLAKGTYKFTIHATDLAGNAEVTAGSNTLRVK